LEFCVFKKGAGTLLTLAFALATLRFGVPSLSRHSPGDESGGGIASAGKSRVTTKASPTAQAGYTGGCTAYLPEKEDHGYAYDVNLGSAKKVLDAFFGSKTPYSPSKDLPDGVHYVIALTPDPGHTNLSLMFDREISVLQQAAQDDGYLYNSSWFPWKKDEPRDSPYLADRQHSDDLTEGREACPGVLLFRKSPTAEPSQAVGRSFEIALVVLIVGEQPTGGINGHQWENAIAWLKNHARGLNDVADDGVLRILGPSFTGSLVSLERDLVEAKTDLESATHKFHDYRIYSGGVTGCSTIQWFQHRLQDATELKDKSTFGTFQENDELHIFRFLEFLKNQGTEPQDTAILSEDETAYSYGELGDITGARGPCSFPYAQENRPVRLVYPRDISALRDAYQKQSVFNGESSSNEHSVHAILRDEADAKESRDVTDTVPSYSGASSALAQEAYLYGLVSFLRTHHTRYLLLRCTNPLDFLFLTRFFHRAYPEARIVVVGTDLLFRREIDTTEFRGVLALSSYPLLPRDQHWSKITEDGWEARPHDHLVFEGHLLEGIYIAARYLLQYKDNRPTVPPAQQGASALAPIQLTRTIPTPDYADPFWFHSAGEGTLSTHPPTWLATVGRDGYWPVAVLGDNAYPAMHLESRDGDKALPDGGSVPVAPISTMVELVGKNGQHYELKLGANERSSATPPTFNRRLLLNLPLPWLICALLSVLLVSYQFWGVYKGSKHSSDGLFSVFRRSNVPSQGYLLGMSCALATMPLVEVCGIVFVPKQSALLSSPNWQFYGALSILCVATVLIARKLLDRYVFSVACSFYVSLAIFAFIYGTAFGANLERPNRIPLFYRMAHLTDGVSPLVPILLLTLGFYLWNWHAMAGNLMLAEGKPTLPGRRVVTPPKWGILASRFYAFIGYAETPSALGINVLDIAETRISQEIGNRVLKVANPLSFPWRIVAVPVFLGLSALVCFAPHNLPLLSLEGSAFNVVVNGCLLGAFLLTAVEALRLYSTWVSLRRLLVALGRLRLRRTIARLRPVDANSLWSVSGNVQRVQYRMFNQQLDAARRMMKISPYPLVSMDRVIQYGDSFAAKTNFKLGQGIAWRTKFAPVAGMPRLLMREILSDAVAEVLNVVLLPEWHGETGSMNLVDDFEVKDDEKGGVSRIPLSDRPDICAAEEFVSFQYIAFIQNIVARMRTMTLSMVFLFVTVCFAISFYPFVPRTEITVWMILNLALIGFAVAYVYAGMDRDEILSYIANTRPGRLGVEFWVKLAGFLIGPVIGILTTQFPTIADSILGWLQPGLDAIK
jgi:hypothetical protein